MADNKINVGGRLHSAATGNILTGANEILDDNKNKKQSVINAETDAALANRYSKEETYNKDELNNLITTPNVQYVTVTATEQTTAATDVLPATGAANTIYRIGNWDGSQYMTTVYSEYAWNGSAYVLLNTKEYGIDNLPISGSENLVKSGGVAEIFEDTAFAGEVVGDPTGDWNKGDAEDYIDKEIAKVKNWVSNTPVTNVVTVSSLPASGNVNTLYRVAGTNTYSEYGWNGTQFVKLDEKEYGIDDEPTAGSDNLVKSGEVYKLQKTTALHFSLVGAGDTGVEQQFNVIPNHNYTLLISKLWNISEVTSTSYIFVLAEIDGQGIETRLETATKANYSTKLKLNYTDNITQSKAKVFIRANSGETVDFYLIDNTSESILTTQDVKKISDDYYFDLKKKVGIDSVILNGVTNKWIKADGSLNGNGNFRTTIAKNDGYKKVIVHSQCGDNNLTDGMVPVAFYNGEPSTSTFMQSASAAPLYNRNTPTWYEMDVPEGAQYICACSRNNYTDVEMYLLEHSVFDKLVQDFMNVGLVKTEQSLTDAEKLQSRKNIGIDDEFLNEKSTIDGVAIYGMESGYIDADGNKMGYGTYRRSYIPNKGYSKILALCGCDTVPQTLGITFVSFYSGTPGADTFMSEESTTPVYTTTAWTWYEVNVPATAKYIGVTTKYDSRYPLKALLFYTDDFLKDIDERLGAVEEELGTSRSQYELIKEDIGLIGIDNKSAGMSFTSSTFTESKFPFAKREVTGKRVGIKPAVYLNTPYHMQGAAIYENILFITCEGGYGNVTFVDMRNGEVIQFTPELIKTNNEHHNNQAFFGTEKYDENDYFPLLYISGASDSIGCIEVYRITGEYGNWTMNVVQTIGLPLNNPEYDITSAEISLNGSNMIAMGYKSSSYSSTVTENTMRIADLGELPPLSAGNTTITTVVDAWDLTNNLPYYQANIILNNMLYIGFGRKLAVIDLVNKTEEIIQLYNFSMEQEAYFLYNNALYVAGIGSNITYGKYVPIVYYIEFIKE